MKNLFYLEFKKYTLKKVNYLLLIIVLISFSFSIPVEDLYFKHNFMVDLLLSQSITLSILYCLILSPSYSKDYKVSPYHIISKDKNLTKKVIANKIFAGWLVTSVIGIMSFSVDILRLLFNVSIDDIKYKVLISYIYNIDNPGTLLNIIIWILSIVFFCLAYTLVLLTISSFTTNKYLSYILGFVTINYLYFMDFFSPFLPKLLYIISPLYGLSFSNLSSFRISNLSLLGSLLVFIALCVICPFIQYKNFINQRRKV